MPGTYLVRSAAHTIFRTGKPILIDGRRFPDLYPAQYFPNAPDRTSAQALTIHPGTEAEADFSLSAVPSYSVSGVLSSTERGFNASCINSSGDPVSNAFRVEPRSGQFTIFTSLPDLAP